MDYQDMARLINELKLAVAEAKRSGTRYRPEHKGFDLAIYNMRIEPMISQIENSKEALSASQLLQFQEIKEEIEKALRRLNL